MYMYDKYCMYIYIHTYIYIYCINIDVLLCMCSIIPLLNVFKIQSTSSWRMMEFTPPSVHVVLRSEALDLSVWQQLYQWLKTASMAQNSEQVETHEISIDLKI